MTNNRSNGEGTIFRNRTRNRFEGQITVGINASGKTVRQKISGRTPAEVAKKMSEVRERCSHGPGLPSDVTVGDWLGYWVSSVLPSANIASATRESYETLCARYLMPRLGRVCLVKLAPADVRAMLNSMSAEGYSSNTQRLARAALRRASRVAEAEGYVSRNVAVLTDGVKLNPRKSRTMQPSEVTDLLASTFPELVITVVRAVNDTRKGTMKFVDRGTVARRVPPRGHPSRGRGGTSPECSPAPRLTRRGGPSLVSLCSLVALKST